MVLAIHSSTSVIINSAAFATVGLCALFLRSLALQKAAPSLDQGRFSFLADAPLIGRVYNHFNPKKPVEPPVIKIGTPNDRISSFDTLVNQLVLSLIQKQFDGVLVVYSKDLSLDRDPGILELKPKKLILVGVQITPSRDEKSLDQLLIKKGWRTSNNRLHFVEARTVDEALQHPLLINPMVSTEPLPTIYYVP